MLLDSWVLTAFFTCNALLIVMAVVAYAYQSIQDRKHGNEGIDNPHTPSANQKSTGN